uniref:Uncharacterized protein n=1 Tax=Brassica oleracea TaxID=3712 RepID=A0A3P6AHN5_BRAOL|nr:unnamed protein product [Brassica oleracea]
MVGRLSTLGLILSQDICFLSIVFVAFGSGGSISGFLTCGRVSLTR